MDTVVLNMDISLEKIISCSSGSAENEHLHYSHKRVRQQTSSSALSAGTLSRDFILTNDHNGPNTGSFLTRESAFSHWFLKEAFAQSQLVPPSSAGGKAHPFEYEQRAFHFLLDSQVWADRRLPLYPGAWWQMSLCLYASMPLHYAALRFVNH